MKTSNKIIVAGLGLILIAALAGLIFLKNNMNVTRVDQALVGNLKSETKVLAPALEADTLYLDDDYNYLLEPNTTAVSLVTDENLIDYIKMTTGSNLRFYREGSNNIQPSHFTTLIIGVHGKEKLVIVSSDGAKISSSGTLSTDLEVVADDEVRLDLQASWNTMDFELANRAHLTLSGTANHLSINAEDKVQIKAEELVLAKVQLDLSDQAFVSAKRRNK